LTTIKGRRRALHTLRSAAATPMSRFVPHRHLWSPARLSSVALLDANDWLSSATERLPDAARMLGRLGVQ